MCKFSVNFFSGRLDAYQAETNCVSSGLQHKPDASQEIAHRSPTSLPSCRQSPQIQPPPQTSDTDPDQRCQDESPQDRSAALHPHQRTDEGGDTKERF